MTPSAPDRLAFFDIFARTEVVLMLDAPAIGDLISPRVFDTSQGALAIGYPSEEALVDDAGEAHYAVLPSRAVAAHLAAADLGLVFDPNGAGELLTPADLTWFTNQLTTPTKPTKGTPEGISSLGTLPENLIAALRGRVADTAGLATSLVIAKSTDGPLIAVLGSVPGAQDPLAAVLSEALVFSGQDANWSIAFLPADDPLAARLLTVGHEIKIPKPDPKPQRSAPGSDPDAPPKLR